MTYVNVNVTSCVQLPSDHLMSFNDISECMTSLSDVFNPYLVKTEPASPEESMDTSSTSCGATYTDLSSPNFSQILASQTGEQKATFYSVCVRVHVCACVPVCACVIAMPTDVCRPAVKRRLRVLLQICTETTAAATSAAGHTATPNTGGGRRCWTGSSSSPRWRTLTARASVGRRTRG